MSSKKYPTTEEGKISSVFSFKEGRSFERKVKVFHTSEENHETKHVERQALDIIESIYWLEENAKDCKNGGVDAENQVYCLN